MDASESITPFLDKGESMRRFVEGLILAGGVALFLTTFRPLGTGLSGLLALLLFFPIFLVYFLGRMYNDLQESKNRVEKAISNIENIGQRLQQELESLAMAVEHKAGHRSDLYKSLSGLMKVTEGASSDFAAAGTVQSVNLNLPELANDAQYASYTAQVSTLSEEYQAHGMTYDRIVEEYRNRTRSFPFGLLARAIFPSLVEDYPLRFEESGRRHTTAVDHRPGGHRLGATRAD